MCRAGPICKPKKAASVKTRCGAMADTIRLFAHKEDAGGFLTRLLLWRRGQEIAQRALKPGSFAGSIFATGEAYVQAKPQSEVCGKYQFHNIHGYRARTYAATRSDLHQLGKSGTRDVSSICSNDRVAGPPCYEDVLRN